MDITGKSKIHRLKIHSSNKALFRFIKKARELLLVVVHVTNDDSPAVAVDVAAAAR